MASIQTCNGVILMGTNSQPAGKCCPSTAINPCEPDPEMLVKIFDADYAGGNITWCGLTWTPAQVQAGEEKSLCGIFQQTYSTGSPYLVSEAWHYGASLSLHRVINYSFGLTQWSNFLGISPSPIGTLVRDLKKWTGFPPPAAGSSTVFSSLSLILGVATPTKGDYNITDDFFGSHLSGGITYSWAKGQGW